MIFLQDGPLPVTLPETKPLTRDNFLSGRHIFSGYVSLREGIMGL